MQTLSIIESYNQDITELPKLHKEFGGVVPELAARSHIEKIDWIVKKAIDDSGVNLSLIHI